VGGGDSRRQKVVKKTRLLQRRSELSFAGTQGYAACRVKAEGEDGSKTLILGKNVSVKALRAILDRINRIYSIR
jgi:hypothetical protein